MLYDERFYEICMKIRETGRQICKAVGHDIPITCATSAATAAAPEDLAGLCDTCRYFSEVTHKCILVEERLTRLTGTEVAWCTGYSESKGKKP